MSETNKTTIDQELTFIGETNDLYTHHRSSTTMSASYDGRSPRDGHRVLQRSRAQILLIAIGVLLLSLSGIWLHVESAYASDVTLEWDGNAEPDVVGYKVYYGTESAAYDAAIDVGTDHAYVIQGLQPGTTYYFAVTAYNESYESDFSEEIHYTVPLPHEALIAHAGPDQTVDEGALVALDGSQSSASDGGILSLWWEQTGGIAVVLSDAHDVHPTFTAPEVEAGSATLTFRLTVTNETGLQSSASVMIDVNDTSADDDPDENDGDDGGGCFIQTLMP